MWMEALMTFDLIGGFEPRAVLAAAGIAPDVWAVAAVCLIGTAILVALCVPGILMPTAIAAGALLGPWAGVALVVAGAVCGSQILFTVSRRLPVQGLSRVGERLPRVQASLERHGFWYVAASRVIGIPHFLVTLASAATPMRARTFVIANAVGFFPVLCLSAIAGHAL